MTKTDSGVRLIEANGGTFHIATGPVAVLRWEEQIASDDALEHGDVCFGLFLRTFVNWRDGFTFASQETIGKAARVSERTAGRRLRKLIERGHVLQQRRRRQQATMYLVLQDPPENDLSNVDQDRTATGVSKTSQDQTMAGVSKEQQDPPANGVSENSDIGLRHDNGVHQDRTTTCVKTRQTQNFNDAKTEACERITCRDNLLREPTDGAAVPLGAPQAPSICDGRVADQCTSIAGSLAPLKGRSPAREIPPLVNEDLPIGIYPEVSPDDEIPRVDLDFIDSPREASELIVDAPRIRPGIAARPAPEGEPPPFAGFDPTDAIATESEAPPTKPEVHASRFVEVDI